MASLLFHQSYSDFIPVHYDKKCCICGEWATWLCDGHAYMPPALCDKHFYDTKEDSDSKCQ